MGPVATLICSLVYLFLHCIIFFVFAKRRPVINNELGVFSYHLISFFVAFFILIVAKAFNSIDVSIFNLIGVLSLHMIYSLSFLELWALSDGGFSLAILRAISVGSKIDVHGVNVELRVRSSEKVAQRVITLERLLLVTSENDVYKISKFGRIVNSSVMVIEALITCPKAGRHD